MQSMALRDRTFNPYKPDHAKHGAARSHLQPQQKPITKWQATPDRIFNL
jgi:hypothetical protein